MLPTASIEHLRPEHASECWRGSDTYRGYEDEERREREGSEKEKRRNKRRKEESCQ
jgi:hypothetical protein